jgi:hypothetical protein
MIPQFRVFLKVATPSAAGGDRRTDSLGYLGATVAQYCFSCSTGFDGPGGSIDAVSASHAVRIFM